METQISKFFEQESWSVYLIVPIVGILLGLGLQWLIFTFLKLNNKRKTTVLKEQLFLRLKTPAKFLLPILFIYSFIDFMNLDTFWYKVVEAFIIVNFTWVLIAFLRAMEEVVKNKFEIIGNHKTKDRKILTQLRFIKNILYIIIITLAIAAILWNIPSVRKLGTTILTSAGVIGIVVGVAAQKSIANLITGFEIAFTQPIKIDDEVVIEGEFGTVEDITLTYVVIKIWDWRRLVLPLSYFNDKPFVNWTFNSQKLIGSVFFYVDYTFPVTELRAKLSAVLKDDPLWDKNISDLLVTDIDNNSMELRATFSARNASDCWNLRCSVREQLMAYIQKEHFNALPKFRSGNIAKI
ncbi:mechanosensitive ion channel domain-containing protein [uncultured Maribacter sp.]|uniref:mechanosensitive ion channel family protein n=1 Tax=uncultured Maribacter sp. TaxID=431308 RepID=UPI0030EDE496|tara:strand:+ start:86862 stop:87914 length:1053 start_codon:yes stop_codon:yes gene_type:complete